MQLIISTIFQETPSLPFDTPMDRRPCHYPPLSPPSSRLPPLHTLTPCQTHVRTRATHGPHTQTDRHQPHTGQRACWPCLHVCGAQQPAAAKRLAITSNQSLAWLRATKAGRLQARARVRKAAGSTQTRARDTYSLRSHQSAQGPPPEDKTPTSTPAPGTHDQHSRRRPACMHTDTGE